MPMSDSERSHWKQQLQYADKVWHESGLISSPGGSVFTDPNVVPIHRYIQDYRGDQDDPFSGAELAAGDRFIANLSFSLTNTVISILSGRDPEPIVKARSGSLAKPNAQRLAMLNKIMLQIMMRDGNYKREADRALQCGLTTPHGLVRHGFTPGIEEYSDGDQVFARFKNEKPDFPWIRFYRPWDFRIDPLANNFDPDQEPRWVAFRDIHTDLEIKRNPNLVKRQDWKPTFTPAPYRNGQETLRKSDSPDAPQLYEAWTIYDATERKCFALSDGAEREVRRETDWPLEWGQLPYSILTFNEQLDSPIGIPFPKLYAHEQAMYNRVWTILNTIITRTRRLVFVNGLAFEGREDQKENLFDMKSLMEFIETGGNPNEVVREIALGIIDPTLLGLLGQLREQIREIIGVSQFDRGQRANVETAAEANQIGAGSATQKSRVQEKFELFWKNIITVSHRAMHQIRDDRKIMIPLLGEESNDILTADDRSAGFARTTIDELRGDFDIAVRLNSTLPLDTSMQFAKAAAVYNLLGGPQATMVDQLNSQRDLVDFAEQDPNRWIITADQAKRMAQQASQGEDGGSSQDAQVSGASIGPLLASMGGGR